MGAISAIIRPRALQPSDLSYAGSLRGRAFQPAATCAARDAVFSSAPLLPAAAPELLSLDGCWIAADARLDARRDVAAALGLQAPPARGDVELILRAWQKWGRECVHHFTGDFAFVIWDSRTNTCFAARDHFGIKPLYWAAFSGGLIASNLFGFVRWYPALRAARVNPQAIADFLQWSFNDDPETTAIQNIYRLPPAHSLVWSGGEARIDRYWQIPIDREIRYRHEGEYVERFRELLENATRDRVDQPRAAILMSGGLDSTSVAASALRPSSGVPICNLRAYTAIYDRLIPDTERHYAAMAARELGLDIEFLKVDDYSLFQGSEDRECQLAEPSDNPLSQIFADLALKASRYSSVVLSGDGGDAMFLCDWQPYLKSLVAQKRYGAAVYEIFRYLRLIRRVPYWDRVRSRLRKAAPEYDPSELLSAQLRDLTAAASRSPSWEFAQTERHPIRPRAEMNLRTAFWSKLLETATPGVTGAPVEFRYPFFDVRLVEFLLSIPPVPWSVNKHLLRRCMTDVLPREILQRPKTTVQGFPVLELLRKNRALNSVAFSTQLCYYVHTQRFQELSVAEVSERHLYAVRVASLAKWLTVIDREDNERGNQYGSEDGSSRGGQSE